MQSERFLPTGEKHLMKVKNLTIGKIKDTCKKHKHCKECPLTDIKWACLGLKNLTEKELEKDLIIKQPKRKYYVRFAKHRTFVGGNSGMTFQDNCGFCVKDLNSESIKRPFIEENTIVENLMVKEIKTNKVIYVGNDYQEFLETIKEINL